MAEGKKTANGDVSDNSPWADLLKSAATQLVPVLLTAGSLIGFVAFAGAVIVWTRFSAAKVPADQVVNVVPQEELVAIGSSLLLLFGFFGALAVIAVFLIDRGGRVTPGMSRGLLLLLTVEGVAAILLVNGASWQHTAVAVEAFILAMGVILWSTFSATFTRLDRLSLPNREGRERVAPPKNGAFRSASDRDPVSGWMYLKWLVVVLGVAIEVALLIRLFGVAGIEALMVGLGVLIAGLAVAVLFRQISFYREPAQVKAREEQLEEEQAEAKVRADEVRWLESALASLGLPPLSSDDPKPPRFELRGPGVVLVASMLTLAAVGPWAAFEKWWLLASLGSAIILGAGLWRIASLAESRFTWYGLAVFISVPLFGTLTTMARNIEDPQVQPMALIRNTDGPDEAIQGLYVTEADERIYFATVATEGCTHQLAAHSGRLLWVPRKEVVAMAVGPSQDVNDAANAALEMAYALTPGQGAPSDRARLAVTDGNAPTSSVKAGEPTLDKRLENVGPAIRPNFGTGLSLVPEAATPGGVVTLRMSQPNPDEEVEGFGAKREGRTLRLGGVPVPIFRERAPSAEAAEFVKTGNGKVLALDKEGIYGRGKEGRFYLVENPATYNDARFVRLSDSSGAEVEGDLQSPTGSYLELQSKFQEKENGDAELLEGQRVILRSGEPSKLRASLLSQAWHENHIKFRVPDNASSGAISVECQQLAGEPLLHVARPPKARIAVQMQAGSENVSFDGAGSRDDGEIVSRRWTIEGHVRGRGATVSVDLPPRLAPYAVRLAVTDGDGQTDSAQLRVLRLPASLFPFAKDKPELLPKSVKRVRRALMAAMEREAPAKIELDGHSDDVGESSYNLGLSLRRAETVRRDLLDASSTESPPGVSNQIPVTLRAFGESCPLRRHHGRSPVNRRVEVFILGGGATVVPPDGCHAGREEETGWLPPPLSP